MDRRAPEVCNFFFCSTARLTNLGSITFASSHAAVGGGAAEPISSFTADGDPHQITMISPFGALRAEPSALTSGGGGFSDIWVHA